MFTEERKQPMLSLPSEIAVKQNVAQERFDKISYFILPLKKISMPHFSFTAFANIA